MKTPWEGNDNLLQYSGLENLMDERAWWAAAHGVTKVRCNWTHIHNLQKVSWECYIIRQRGKPVLHFPWRLYGRICFLAFQLLETACISWLMAVFFIFQSFSDSDPTAFFLWDFLWLYWFTWIIQNNSLFQKTSYLQSPFCYIKQHVNRFWGLWHGHLWGAFFWLS